VEGFLVLLAREGKEVGLKVYAVGGRHSLHSVGVEDTLGEETLEFAPTLPRFLKVADDVPDVVASEEAVVAPVDAQRFHDGRDAVLGGGVREEDDGDVRLCVPPIPRWLREGLRLDALLLRAVDDGVVPLVEDGAEGEEVRDVGLGLTPPRPDASEEVVREDGVLPSEIGDADDASLHGHWARTLLRLDVRPDDDLAGVDEDARASRPDTRGVRLDDEDAVVGDADLLPVGTAEFGVDGAVGGDGRVGRPKDVRPPLGVGSEVLLGQSGDCLLRSLPLTDGEGAGLLAIPQSAEVDEGVGVAGVVLVLVADDVLPDADTAFRHGDDVASGVS